MWLLKLHFSISVLCLLTIKGFANVFEQNIKDNGWYDPSEQKKNIFAIFACFVPILNFMMCIMAFTMISMKKEDFDKMCKDANKKQ